MLLAAVLAGCSPPPPEPETEDALIQTTTRKAIALVALYRAFGGGIGVQSAVGATPPARPR